MFFFRVSDDCSNAGHVSAALRRLLPSASVLRSAGQRKHQPHQFRLPREPVFGEHVLHVRAYRAPLAAHGSIASGPDAPHRQRLKAPEHAALAEPRALTGFRTLAARRTAPAMFCSMRVLSPPTRDYALNDMNDPVIRPIPLDRLERSPANVRRTEAGKTAFAELKASIAARHRRSYVRDDVVYDPLHYLSLLEKKPGALDQAAPLRGWKLDPAFDTLRRLLEARFGPRGKREYIQVLRLHEDFPERQVAAAVRDAVKRRLIGFDAVKHLLLARIERRPVHLDLSRYPHLPRPFVAATRSADYATLLAAGHG